MLIFLSGRERKYLETKMIGFTYVGLTVGMERSILVLPGYLRDTNNDRRLIAKLVAKLGSIR